MEKSSASTLSYTTGLTVAGFSFSFNELIAVAGLVIAAATFVINWRYKHLRYRLEKEALHAAEKPRD